MLAIFLREIRAALTGRRKGIRPGAKLLVNPLGDSLADSDVCEKTINGERVNARPTVCT